MLFMIREINGNYISTSSTSSSGSSTSSNSNSTSVAPQL